MQVTALFSLYSVMWYFTAMMWSVRMRASKSTSTEGRGQGAKAQNSGIHISGAEGLYDFSVIGRITRDYLLRAMNHPRGNPDQVVITVERVRRRPVVVPPLPFSTVRCNSPDEARDMIRKLLLDTGVSERAVRNGMRVVFAKAAMQGASLVLGSSGIRVEPDRKRGVRVSRLGIRKAVEQHLCARLGRQGINTPAVKEAIVLASKVASCKAVIAELCISDDPDYTTGYVASRKLGYIRIPRIKQKGSLSGGRVFFIDSEEGVKKIIEYLEKIPVIIGKREYPSGGHRKAVPGLL